MKQFTLGKSFDTFTPLGPVVSSADSVADRNRVDVQTVINGEPIQKGNTRDLIFDVPTLIEYLTRGLTMVLVAQGNKNYVHGGKFTGPAQLDMMPEAVRDAAPDIARGHFNDDSATNWHSHPGGKPP